MTLDDLDCPYCKTRMGLGRVHALSKRAVFVASNGDRHDLEKYTSTRAFECADCGTIVLQGRFAGDEAASDGPYR